MLLNIYRGSKYSPSMIGIKVCSGLDWLGVAVYISFCLWSTYCSISVYRRELQLKKEYGTLSKTEFHLTDWQITKLILVSIFGGWISGALGMGGSSILNTIMMSIFVPPQVASATGMYIMIFTNGASTLTYLSNNMLNTSYAVMTGIVCSIGSVMGMYLNDKYMKRYFGQSF